MTIITAHQLSIWMEQWASLRACIHGELDSQAKNDSRFYQGVKELQNFSESFKSLEQWMKWIIELEKMRDQVGSAAKIEEALIDEMIELISLINRCYVGNDEETILKELGTPGTWRYRQYANCQDRLVNIGKALHLRGDLELMQGVYGWVRHKGQMNMRSLELIWNGIGSWKS